MSIKEGFSKKATFDMSDSIYQKIHKLMVMIDKLVMEDEGRIDYLNPKYTSLIEVEVRLDITMIREDFKRGLDQKCTEDDQGMDKTIEVGQDMILIIEAATGIIQEVVRGMGDQIIKIEGETLEAKIMIEIGVGHTKYGTEPKETVEVLVKTDQGQVQ